MLLPSTDSDVTRLCADMAPTIPVNAMGSQGFKASSQGLGCMGMSAFYKDADHTATEEESVAVIHKAIELGFTLLDTSDIYGMRWHIHHHTSLSTSSVHWTASVLS